MPSLKAATQSVEAAELEAAAVAQEASPPPAGPSTWRWLLSWSAWFMLAYAGGTLVVLGVLLRSLLSLRRLTHQSRPLEAGPVRARFDQLRARLGVNDNVDLLVAPGAMSPIAAGLLRRRIIVPESLLTSLDAKQIDVILTHELAHHRRRDTWCIALENVLLIAWWFNPLYWAVVSSLSRAREDCCDDLLLEMGVTDDDTYCESLLRAASMVGRPQMARAALGFADQFHPLGRRIRRIMDLSIPRRAGLSPLALAVLILLGLCIWPGVRLAAAPGWTGQILDTPPPPVVEQAPGKLVFEGLYRHRSHGQVMDTPEHRWLKRQEDGLMAVVSDVPFMETVFYVEGGRNQGFTRYESQCWGNDAYSMTMEFETGKVLVSWPDAHGNWESNEYAVPARSLFAPNSEPDPYCTAPIMGEILSVPMGSATETQVYDWNSAVDDFDYYRIRAKNTGLEEVTVPCGRFMATRIVMEQTIIADTLLKKRAHDITDFWVLEDGTIVRILRSRGPYEVDLLDWKTPVSLPGLIERRVPQMYEDSRATPTPPPPVTAEHVPMYGAERSGGCWMPGGFKLPHDAAVYLTPFGGEADGVTRLGIGAGKSNCRIVLRQLPRNPEPSGETFIGDYEKDDVIPFCLSTTRRGKTYWVSTLDDSPASRVAFWDVDGSRRGQPVVRQVGPDRWIMNLDDADPGHKDDDDNDIAIVIRLDKQ